MISAWTDESFESMVLINKGVGGKGLGGRYRLVPIFFRADNPADRGIGSWRSLAAGICNGRKMLAQRTDYYV